jgi:hypothetical protein
MYRENFMIEGSFNPVAAIALCPDLTLDMLEKITERQLTIEQRAIAKMSAIELANHQSSEITVRDLVQMWANSPVLQEFAAAIKRCLLF